MKTRIIITSLIVIGLIMGGTLMPQERTDAHMQTEKMPATGRLIMKALQDP